MYDGDYDKYGTCMECGGSIGDHARNCSQFDGEGPYARMCDEHDRIRANYRSQRRQKSNKSSLVGEFIAVILMYVLIIFGIISAIMAAFRLPINGSFLFIIIFIIIMCKILGK